MKDFELQCLAYARKLYELSQATRESDDRIKYTERLAALVPIFIEIFQKNSIENLKTLIQNEIRREGLDFFPKNEADAAALGQVRQSFFNLVCYDQRTK